MYYHRIKRAASVFFRNLKKTTRREDRKRQRTTRLWIESLEPKVVMAPVVEPPLKTEALYCAEVSTIEPSMEESSRAGDVNVEFDQLQFESPNSGGLVVDSVRNIGGANSLIVEPNQFPFDSQPIIVTWGVAIVDAPIPGIKGEPDGLNTLPTVPPRR